MKTHRTPRRLAPLALAALWLGALPADASAVEIIVPAETTITGPQVILAELAEVRGTPDEIAAYTRRLDQIQLGPAPAPGASRVFSAGTVETRLRSALGSPADLVLTLPSQVSVFRAAHLLGPDEVVAELEAWIEGALALPDADIAVFDLSLKEGLALPVGEVELRFDDGGRPPLGRATVTVRAFQGGQQVLQQRLTATVRVTAPVVVLTRDVQVGAILSAGDLRIDRRPVEALTGAPWVAVEEVAGQEARRSLRVGAVLTDRDVVLPDDVIDGDPVTVVVRSNAVTLSAPGEARGDGRIGEIIPVYCVATGKVLRGRITGPGTVEVTYHAAR